ncbi:MAG TPA: hypothetical protein VK386_08255, partial [Acidimicrobiales bacterium]|nr:hypothetical protein [Acidimicrobiales bacterium]
MAGGTVSMSERIWLRRAWIGLVAGAMVATATAGVAAAAHHPSSKPPKIYYLALGDSLSVGWQPSSAHPSGSETTQGYTNDLDKFYKKVIKGLQYEDIGCPGETTSTMIHGGCDGGTVYSDGNQLAQAESFIEHNKVAFVTIDIGANDV